MAHRDQPLGRGSQPRNQQFYLYKISCSFFVCLFWFARCMFYSYTPHTQAPASRPTESVSLCLSSSPPLPIKTACLPACLPACPHHHATAAADAAAPFPPSALPFLCFSFTILPSSFAFLRAQRPGQSIDQLRLAAGVSHISPPPPTHKHTNTHIHHQSSCTFTTTKKKLRGTARRPNA